MPIAFDEYLEAKYAVDSRSLNSAVQNAFLRILNSKNHIALLDVGTGTGAMIRRLINYRVGNSISITGVDNQTELLPVAQAIINRQLSDQGFALEKKKHLTIGSSSNTTIEVGFENQPLTEFQHYCKEQSFDVITAQALMDLVPLDPTLKGFWAGLKPGGILYTTLNYDGDTTLLPGYQNLSFERKVLDFYNLSMETRKVGDQLTGGAYAGRRLYDAITNNGFTIIAAGSSDWNLIPLEDAYRDQDARCLEALLDMIRLECEKCPGINPVDLKQWFEQRLELLGSGKLGMIVHQLDILARKISG